MTIKHNEKQRQKRRQIARCEECGEDIFEDDREVYIDAQKNYFCSLECCHEFYGIKKSEDCLEEDE